MAENDETLAAIRNLTELLEAKLNKGGRIAIATPEEDARVKIYDGSLNARMTVSPRRSVYIETPRAPGLRIELVDHLKDELAPEGAIYQMLAYIPLDKGVQPLNGDVCRVYVGKNGIILDEAARMLARQLPRHKE